MRLNSMVVWLLGLGCCFVVSIGCQSPYYADQGALAGGLGGAGVGALIGNATGHTGAGALIGAGVGAVTGGLVGSGLDNIEARNRAQIAAQMGRPVPTGAVSTNDVVAMTKAGVDPDLIVAHIRANGVARPMQANELIMLQQEGVCKPVIQTLQSTPPAGTNVAQAVPLVAPQPMYAAPYYYPPPPPYWGY
jgi:hypothetical protein